MEEKLEAANVNQKRLFLIVFQRFIMILSEHLLRSDTDGRDPDTDWYRWTIGRLQQVFLMVGRSVYLTLPYPAKHDFLLIFPTASRAGAEVQQHTGNAALHIRSGYTHFRGLPAVCGTARLTTNNTSSNSNNKKTNNKKNIKRKHTKASSCMLIQQNKLAEISTGCRKQAVGRLSGIQVAL